MKQTKPRTRRESASLPRKSPAAKRVSKTHIYNDIAMTGIDCIISTPDDERKICLLRICSYAISNEVDFFTALSALELEDEFRIFDYKERNFEYEEWLHNPTHPRELISIFRRCLVSIEKDSADID